MRTLISPSTPLTSPSRRSRLRSGLGAAAIAAVAVGGLTLGAGSAAAAGTTVLVSPGNTQGFSFSETRANGHNVFTADGLHVYTDSNTDVVNGTNTDKAAAYKQLATAVPLATIVAAPQDPALTLASVTGGKPAYQLTLDKDGDGGFDGNLVSEPEFYGAKWWDNYSSLTDKPELAGCGYKLCATLDDISAAYPNAKITYIGYSLGSGVKGDAVLKSLTFLDTTYTFGLDPVASGQADLAVGVTAPPFSGAGKSIPVTVTVTNNGPGISAAATATVVTPGYLISGASAGGTVKTDGTTTFPVPVLTSGQSVTFSVTATPSTAFQFGLGVAYVFPAGNDPNLFNNIGIAPIVTR